MYQRRIIWLSSNNWQSERVLPIILSELLVHVWWKSSVMGQHFLVARPGISNKSLLSGQWASRATQPTRTVGSTSRNDTHKPKQLYHTALPLHLLVVLLKLLWSVKSPCCFLSWDAVGYVTKPAHCLTLSRGRRAESDFGQQKASNQNFIRESIQKVAQT